MLKTLEEPPSFAHLILLTSRPANVLPTIASRCQQVRFEAPSRDERSPRALEATASTPQTAHACARLCARRRRARAGAGARRRRRSCAGAEAASRAR